MLSVTHPLSGRLIASPCTNLLLARRLVDRLGDHVDPFRGHTNWSESLYHLPDPIWTGRRRQQADAETLIAVAADQRFGGDTDGVSELAVGMVVQLGRHLEYGFVLAAVPVVDEVRAVGRRCNDRRSFRLTARVQ